MVLMSSLSRDEVARVAALARIDLTEAEIDRFSAELSVVVDAVAQVGAAVSPEIPRTSHPIALGNVFRADDPVTPLDRDELLAGAPDAQDGKFLVPQILEED